MRILFPKLLLCVLTVGVVASGCSISYSVGKSSDSVKSISDSSSPSSSSEKTSYNQDLRELTVAYTQSGHQPDEYMREVGKIAETHGITDWERQQSTYIAIGEGLKKAGIEESQVQDVPFLKDIIEGNPDALRSIQKGYAS